MREQLINDITTLLTTAHTQCLHLIPTHEREEYINTHNTVLASLHTYSTEDLTFTYNVLAWAITPEETS